MRAWPAEMVTDWNPETGMMQDYRVLENSDNADSGVERSTS